VIQRIGQIGMQQTVEEMFPGFAPDREPARNIGA
jgi:hypothetical protein